MTPETLQKLAVENHEPAWFIEQRLAALKMMDTLEMPTVQRFNYRTWSMIPDIQQITTNSVSDVKDVVLTDFFTAVRDYPELIQKYFMKKVIKTSENKLTA